MIDRSATDLERLEASPAFACRQLDPAELDEARQVAEEVGVHAAYVRNALEESFLDGRDQIYGIHGVDRLLGLIYFGGRGNLIVVERSPLSAQRLAAFIRDCPWEWRIVLARREVVQELCRHDSRTPLVNRQQVYYGATSGEIDAELARTDARRAERRDSKALMQAALELNESDLNVAAWRVNKVWLRDTVRRRIKLEQTVVVGPVGAPSCKLDVGSCGSAAAVLEGVYTDPKQRGQGLASRLVAHVADEFLRSHPLVCLHVAAENAPARRAYERAGMRALGECWLMLRG